MYDGNARLPQDARVIVSIVTMNCEAMVAACLKAIFAGDLLPSAVVIIENGGASALHLLSETLRAALSIDGVSRQLKTSQGTFQIFDAAPSRPQVVLCDPGANLGYAGGNNVALAQDIVTDWHAVWILNPDTIPAPGALSALLARQRETSCGMVGSRLVFTASERVQAWGGMSWNLWLGRGRNLGYMRDPDEVPDTNTVERRMTFVSGASMFVTRRYVEQVGPMDHEFFMFGEDVEWCLRGRQRKQCLAYAHASLIYHVHGATAGSSRIKAKRSVFSIYFGERSKVLLMRKYLGAFTPLASCAALIGTSEHLLRFRSPTQFQAALRGWWAGMRGETGYRKI